MALRTIVAEVPGHVIWIRRQREVRLMTLVTIRVQKLVVSVYVTRLTRDSLVCTCQREVRGGMIEGAPSPACRRVTLCAVVAEIPGNMVRIRCLLKVRLVALVAISIHQLIVPVGVARLARRCGVRACEREIRTRVIERRRSPCRCCVALCAVVTEVACHVVRICYSLKV